MRQIPQSLLDKVKAKAQNIHNASNPRMEVIAAKATRYLTEGTFLQARTIRTGESNLGPLDICIRREDVNADPTEIVMAYIEDGQAKVATLPYVHRPDEDFVYRYTIGPAVDVACDFDGRWYKITERTGIYFDTSIIWALQTFGEPYLVRVQSNGSLHVQQGESGTSLQLASANVTKCSCLRGWKNTYLWNHDQGIIVAYIRSGAVCYRNYAQQPPDQPALWENERTIVEFDTSVYPADHIAMFRGNDYRVGFTTSINGEMFMTLTPRNWATMAIESHTISAAITGVTVALLPVTYTDIYHEHHISTTLTDVTASLLWAMPYNSFTSASNADNVTVNATCEHFLTNLTATDFEIRDTLNTLFSVTAIQQGATVYDIILTVDNLNYSEIGNLTLKFLGTGTTKGEAGQNVDPFEITFTPTGLEYVAAEPPEVEAIYNE